MEYYDLAKPENAGRAQDIAEAVKKDRIPYPLVAINGEFKMAGAVDFWRISAVVDELLKVKSEA